MLDLCRRTFFFTTLKMKLETAGINSLHCTRFTSIAYTYNYKTGLLEINLA